MRRQRSGEEIGIAHQLYAPGICCPKTICASQWAGMFGKAEATIARSWPRPLDPELRFTIDRQSRARWQRAPEG